MSGGYRVLPLAQDDLFSIWVYLADNAGLDVALEYETRFYRTFEQLGERPLIGHMREDLTARPVRFWMVTPYLIVYRADSTPVEIVRILHGNRDVRRLLS